MFMLEIIGIIVAIGWLFVSVFCESGKFFSIGLVIASVVTMFIFTTPTVIAFIIGNLNLIIIGFISYFIAGGIWSIFKWWRFNVKVKRLYDHYKEKYPNEKQYDYLHAIRSDLCINDLTLPPKSSKMKSNITLWIFSWPISIITWVIGDLVVDICNSIYDMLGNVYVKITASVFGEMKIDE